MESLQTIHKISSSHVSEKGSTFLGFLCPIADFDTQLKLLREEHPKAVHFVTSSRCFNAFRQIEESFSDDGEPRGSSGMPTLKVLRGYSLVDVGFVSVRYFGGTLLGVGGLVRAYTQSVKQAILQAHIIAYKEMEEERWLIPFDRIHHIEYLSQKYHVQIKKESFLNEGVRIVCKGEKIQLEAIRNILFKGA